jgi:hypothetical protein
MKLKRGTIRDDGMVFIEYRKRKSGIAREYWTSQENYKILLKRNNRRVRRNNSKSFEAMPLKRWNEFRAKRNLYCRQRYRLDSDYRIKTLKASMKYSLKRMLSDDLFKLGENIRKLIRASFRNKGLRKDTKTESILGCSIHEFKQHIESQFKDGMSWENRSKWHIDHIVPISIAKTKDDLLRLNHYSNLQPLWMQENIAKRNKILL